MLDAILKDFFVLKILKKVNININIKININININFSKSLCFRSY